MKEEAYYTSIEILSSGFAALIMIIYSLNVHWTLNIIEFVRNYNVISEKKYQWLRVLDTIVSIGVIIAFSYVLFTSISGNRFPASDFAIIVIRPLIFLLGSAEASHACIKLRELYKEKNIW